jgi:hypothetical protein
MNTNDSFYMRLEFLKQNFETLKILKETELNKVLFINLDSLL